MLKSNSTANNNIRKTSEKNYNTPYSEDPKHQELNLYYEIQQGAKKRFTDEFLEISYNVIAKLEASDNIPNPSKKNSNIVCIFSFKEKKYGRAHSYNDYKFSALENMLYSSSLDFDYNTDSLNSNNYQIDIQSIFNSIEEMFCARIFQKKIEIDYAFDNEVYSLGFSSLHLKVILYQIIGKAIELCKKFGKIICTVYTNDTSICIDIQDSGLKYNPELIDGIRRFREDSDFFFNDEFIKSFVSIHGGIITKGYHSTCGNVNSIIIPKK